jgi:predicted O-methyltransferase YrrM
MYNFDKSDIERTVDWTKFAGIMDGCSEFQGVIGREHYKLLAYLSTLFNNSTIIDIGTHRGSSALALSYNPTNTVHTFDILDKVENHSIKARDNIRFHMDNLFEAEGQAKWTETILKCPFLFLDRDL